MANSVDDVQSLEKKIRRQFDFKSIEYLGPNKNFVFKCVDRNDRLLVLKVFFIHPARRQEDVSKAWREIAFHNYAAHQLRLPEVVESAFESDLGIYLLTEFKQMRPITLQDFSSTSAELIERMSSRIAFFHSIRPSSLNPGLRARISEEDLKANAWISSALAECGRFDAAQLKKAGRLCEKIRSNPVVSKGVKILVHGDCRLQNFYFDSDGSVQFRDFEHAGINCPLLDWASLYLSVLPSGHAGKVMQAGLEEVGGASRLVEEAFSFMLLHRASSWIKYNLSYARDPVAAGKRLDQAVKFLCDEVL